jgi:hypothetical protein
MCQLNWGYLLTNSFLFIVFELLLIVALIYSLYFETFNKFAAIKRGDQSIITLFTFFAILSSFYYTLITLIEGQYRILILVINYAMIYYLCFHNGYFRNKLIGIKKKISDFIE